MGVEFTEEHLQAIIETHTIVKEMKEATAIRRANCENWFNDHEHRIRSVERWRYYIVGLGAGIAWVIAMLVQLIQGK